MRVSIYTYMHMYGCLLPLYSPLGSSTVFSVPDHSEHIFSVAIALTARSRHLWFSLNQPPCTWLCIQRLAMADLCFGPLFGWDRELGLSNSQPQAPQWCLPQISDIFEASQKQRGCVSSWRGRQNKADVTKSCVENSWENRTKLWSFHPTNVATFGKSCLFPLSFHLSQQNGWA